MFPSDLCNYNLFRVPGLSQRQFFSLPKFFFFFFGSGVCECVFPPTFGVTFFSFTVCVCVCFVCVRSNFLFLSIVLCMFGPGVSQ